MVRPGDTLTLVWSDEFDALQLDPETWFFETGDGSQYGIPGWGNNELQWYLPNSAQLENGKLVITAREEASNGKSYTSARINTRDRFALRYGRIEARIRLPGGQGIWPAFWMLPQDNVYGGWAASGEIDIMEYVSRFPNEVFGTIHGPGYSGGSMMIFQVDLGDPAAEIRRLQQIGGLSACARLGHRSSPGQSVGGRKYWSAYRSNVRSV